jgi:solute carrier family 25 phosphate transporter 23/24/25/41
LNSEGDTSIREDTLEGLGRSPTSFLTLLFGAIINIAAPSSISSFPATTQTTTSSEKVATDEAEEIANGKMYEGHHAHFTEGVLETKQDNRLSLQSRPPVQQEEPEELEEETFLAPTKKSLLTQVLPDPGYFAAGGLAGVISRTATAPLDRLKVYLIANVGSNNDPVAAMKRGDTTTAARQVGRPLILACRELWNAGGMRSLFAGRSQLQIRRSSS